LLLSPLFFVAGLLFEGLVRVRNRMYDACLLPQARLPHPVVSIGNLTVGGSGKTPLVIHLAQTIARIGGTPALLSRGYGRKAKSAVVLPPEEYVRFPVQLLGDEPALVRQHAPQVWLGISPNRHAVGLQISRRTAQPLFILDDGFQHRRLKRSLDLVIIDRSQPFACNRVLPRGTLREPIAGLRRANIVVINGTCDSQDCDPVEAVIRRIKPDAVVLHCVQQISRLISIGQWKESGVGHDPCSDSRPAFLVAAIGNPDRFRRDVRALGIEIRGSHFYRDHFCLQRRDWLSCASEARAKGAGVLITTEKDAIKAAEALDFPLLVAVQSMQLFEQADLERMLRAMMDGDQ
jgi:tetraacyldisaccharide 4'-kinase